MVYLEITCDKEARVVLTFSWNLALQVTTLFRVWYLHLAKALSKAFCLALGASIVSTLA